MCTSIFRCMSCFRNQSFWFLRSADDRPPRRNPPVAEKGPAWALGGFNLFYFCLPWIPPKFQFFLPTFSWILPKIQMIINEIQVTKIKKYERFIMKSDIGDFGPIWVFFCYWIRLRYNVILRTIIFFSSPQQNQSTVFLERKVQSIASDGSIVNRAEQIKYSDSQD